MLKMDRVNSLRNCRSLCVFVQLAITSLIVMMIDMLDARICNVDEHLTKLVIDMPIFVRRCLETDGRWKSFLLR